MRTVLWVIKSAAGLALFLVLLGFAVKNTGAIAVQFFPGLEWQAPLIVILLAFFTAGVILGILASLAIMVRQRRELLALKRELRGFARSAAAPAAAGSA